MKHEEIKFSIGSYIEDVYGNKGYVKDFCTCAECQKRGFFEPIVEYSDSEEYVTKYMCEHPEEFFSKIGALDVQADRNEKLECNNGLIDIADSISEEKIQNVTKIIFECVTDKNKALNLIINTENVDEVYLENINTDDARSLTVHIDGDYTFEITK